MKYILFVKQECPYCTAAQDLLSKMGKDYKVVNFLPEQQNILNEMKQAYDWATVPMIFCRQEQEIKFIGGFADLQRYLFNE